MFISDKPPTFDEITATFEAIASKAANPKLSVEDGNKKRSE